jgi:hypothetical protein
MIVADREGWHGPDYQKDATSVGRAIALGLIFLVMTNELHIGKILIMSFLKLWDSSSTNCVLSSVLRHITHAPALS